MTVRRCIAAVALVTLAGCGGGGGAGPDDTTNVAAAWRNFLAVEADFTLTGIGSDNASYTLVLGLAPAGSGAYPLTGQLGARSVQLATLVQNGVSLGTTTTTQFYEPTSALFIGATNDIGECTTATANGVLPAAATAGSSGLLYAATSFDRCDASAVVIGSVSNSWSIEFEDGIFFFCTNATFSDTLGNDAGSEQDCIEAGVNGELGALARVAVVLPPTTEVPNGFSLVARNY